MGVFNQTNRMENLQGSNRLNPSSPALQGANFGHSTLPEAGYLRANENNGLDGQNQNPELRQSLMPLQEPQMQDQMQLNMFGDWIGYPNFQNTSQQNVKITPQRMVGDHEEDVIPEPQSNNDSQNNALENNQSLQQVLLQNNGLDQRNISQYNINQQQAQSDDIHYQLQTQQIVKTGENNASIDSKNQLYDNFSDKQQKPTFLQIQTADPIVYQAFNDSRFNKFVSEPKDQIDENCDNEDQQTSNMLLKNASQNETIPQAMQQIEAQKPHESSKSPKKEKKTTKQPKKQSKVSKKNLKQPDVNLEFAQPDQKNEPQEDAVSGDQLVDIQSERVINNEIEKKQVPFSDKDFSKAMQKIKDRNVGNQPPKKPASAYILYQKEKRAEILRRKPQAKVTEVVKEIAQCWQALTKEERMPYKERARKDKDRYDKQIRLLERYSTSLKKPKKCLSAYMIFVKETRPSIVEEHPYLGALDIMKKVGERWQQLQLKDNGIKYFQDKADCDKMRYLKEQKEFYDEVERIHKHTEGQDIKFNGEEGDASSHHDQTNLIPNQSQVISDYRNTNAQIQSKNKGASSTIIIDKKLMMAQQKQDLNQQLVLNQEKGKIGKRKSQVIEDETHQMNIKLINQPAIANDIIEMGQIKSQSLHKKQKLDHHHQNSTIIIDRKDSALEPEGNGNLIPILANQSKKQESQVLKPPKKPQTPYAHFCYQFKQNIKNKCKADKNFVLEGQNGAPNQKSILKAANIQWNTMTSEDKSKFLEMAKDEKTKYQKDLEQFQPNQVKSVIIDQNAQKLQNDNLSEGSSDSHSEQECKETVVKSSKVKQQPRLKNDYLKNQKNQDPSEEEKVPDHHVSRSLDPNAREFENHALQSQQQNNLGDKHDNLGNQNLMNLINPQLLQQMGPNNLQSNLMPMQGLQSIQNQHILNMPNFLQGPNVMNDNLLEDALTRVDIAANGLGQLQNDHSTPGIEVNKVITDNSQGLYGRDRSRALLEYDKMNKLDKSAGDQSYKMLDTTDRLEPIDGLAGGADMGDGMDLDASGVIGNNKKHIIQLNYNEPNRRNQNQQDNDKEVQNGQKMQMNSNQDLIEPEQRQMDSKIDNQQVSYNMGIPNANMQNFNQMQPLRNQMPMNSQLGNFNALHNQQVINNAAQNLAFQQGRIPNQIQGINQLFQMQNLQGVLGNTNVQNAGLQLQQQNPLGLINGAGGVNLQGLNCQLGGINAGLNNLVQNHYLNNLALNNSYLNTINQNGRVLTPSDPLTEKPRINTQYMNEAVSQSNNATGKIQNQSTIQNGQEDQNDQIKMQPDSDKQKMNNKMMQKQNGQMNQKSQNFQQQSSELGMQPQEQQKQGQSQQMISNQFSNNINNQQQQQLMNNNLMAQGSQNQQQLNQLQAQHQAYAEQTKLQLQQRIVQQQHLQQQLLIQTLNNQGLAQAQQVQAAYQQQQQQVMGQQHQQSKVKMMSDQQQLSQPLQNQNQQASATSANQQPQLQSKVQFQKQFQQQNSKPQNQQPSGQNTQQHQQSRSNTNNQQQFSDKDGYIIQQQQQHSQMAQQSSSKNVYGGQVQQVRQQYQQQAFNGSSKINDGNKTVGNGSGEGQGQNIIGSDMYGNNYMVGQQQNMGQMQMQQVRGNQQSVGKKLNQFGNQEADNFLSMAAGQGINSISNFGGAGQNVDQNSSNGQRKISANSGDNLNYDINQCNQVETSQKQQNGQLMQQLIPQASSQQSQFPQAISLQNQSSSNINANKMVQYQNVQQNQQQFQGQMMQISQQNFGPGGFDMRLQNGQKVNQMQPLANSEQFNQMQMQNGINQQFVPQQMVPAQGYHPLGALGGVPGFNNFNLNGLNNQLGLNQMNINMSMNMNMGISNISNMPSQQNGQNPTPSTNNNQGGNGGSLQNMNQQQIMDKQYRGPS